MKKDNNENKRSSSLIRKLAILALVFVLLGTVIFAPLLTSGGIPSVVKWVALAVYLTIMFVEFGVVIVKHIQSNRNK